MRPDAFFDVPPPQRKMTADERLDYLDSLTSAQGRVILQLDENRGWSLKKTVASLLIIVAIACPDPYPDDLRESGSSLPCPPHRGSDGTAGITPPASRERPPSVVAGRPTGPAQLGGPALLSTAGAVGSG